MPDNTRKGKKNKKIREAVQHVRPAATVPRLQVYSSPRTSHHITSHHVASHYLPHFRMRISNAPADGRARQQEEGRKGCVLGKRGWRRGGESPTFQPTNSASPAGNPHLRTDGKHQPRASVPSAAAAAAAAARTTASTPMAINRAVSEKRPVGRISDLLPPLTLSSSARSGSIHT